MSAPGTPPSTASDASPPTAAHLVPTALIDSDHPDVVAFAREIGRASCRERVFVGV